MKKGLILIFMLVFGTCFAQDLEETVYVATENFSQNQTVEGLNELNKTSLHIEAQLNTKDEYFAFINLLVHKAYYLNTVNRKKEAITNYEKAFQLYNEHHILSYDIVEYCLIPLGILYHKTNAYVKAEHTIRHYLQLSEKQNNKQQQISGYINLAKLYQSLSKHQQVIAIVTKGLKIEGLKKQQQRNLNYIKRKSELLLKTNQNRLLLENDLIVTRFNTSTIEKLQLTYESALQNEDYDLAYTSLNRIRALKINKLTSGRSRAQFSFQEAQLHFIRNEKDKAFTKLKNCLAILLPNFNGIDLPNAKDLYPENTFIDVFDLWAALQTEPEKALQSYDLSFYVTELLNKEHTSQESYIISASVNKDRSEKCIALLYTKYQEKRDIKYISRAFNYAECNKALALKWHINKRTLLEQHPTDRLLLKEQTLLKQQQRLTNRLLNRPLNNSKISVRDSLQQQLITTSIDLKQIQDTINKVYVSNDSKGFDIDRLQSKLKTDKACLVSYFYGKNGLYQFMFSPNNMEFNRIDLSVLDQQSISTYISYFENASAINNTISQFRDDAFNLYELLKLNEIGNYQNIIIVADGLLNFISFESLLTQQTTASNYADMPFMVKKHCIAYHTSASFYNESKPYKFRNSALGVFPVFDNSNLKLTYSLDEAEQLDNEVKTAFLMYNEATKKDVLEQINTYSILHLSTHANSGDFTTPANIGFIDSKLYLQDLYNLDLTNDLVVLSACETGVGMLQKGEGSMNLARGFKYAGISNLVVSLWKINDLSTSQLMSNFYSELYKTESAFSANQTSKLMYLNHPDISNIKKSPYYWSAFIYSGDLTAEEPANVYNIFSYIILGLIIALLCWLLIFKQKTWKR
ncbi:CHAT domain-containing protein [Winogradskyella psychrotolerans]|uniref:CHAT domain-containing protein n=1 Tax=Winogradskyella psychrotolerans TaxID=1344585 RepID=UPI001C0713A2|nr:CHAT domain-containing protein [Winogradskyella psychrotolerans]MBU2927902.1 CHAT domain-containing protein [Winogradskyella psychrotolerans]